MAKPPAPPPLLCSQPVPLPAIFQGDYAGAAVVFDLDRLLDWDWTQAALLADGRARLAAADPGSRAQAACQHELAAITCAHLVVLFVGGAVAAPARDDAAGWQALSRLVVQWIAGLGRGQAQEQVLAPFLAAASPSSGNTAG